MQNTFRTLDSRKVVTSERRMMHFGWVCGSHDGNCLICLTGILGLISLSNYCASRKKHEQILKRGADGRQVGVSEMDGKA